jgi:hypothetical protein
MLSAMLQIAEVTPWQVIEEALARMRPPRNKEWLAQKLSTEGKPVTPQGVGNWKVRGVPPGRFIELGEVLGLSARQVAGLDPLPWDKSGPWPFPDIDPARFAHLNQTQIGEIQGKVREMLEKFEHEATAGRSGKSSPSGHGAGKRSAQA